MSTEKETLAAAKRIEQLLKDVKAEAEKRDEIKDSDEYKKKQAAIDTLQREMQKMLDAVPDSLPTLEEEKKWMIDEMNRTGLNRIGNVEAKYRSTNSVNGSRVFKTLGEDIGLFMEIATISQKSLKEFAKGNPDIEEEILDCIEENGSTLVDISLAKK